MNNHSNKVTSADKQQERRETALWIVGFTDGEGCFSISMFRNKTTAHGWQVFPEFVVTQGDKSKHVLDEMQSFFDCGSVVINKRYDNHTEHIYRYCVRKLEDLQTHIIPFFEENNLRTAKQNDFILWKEVIMMMALKEHTDMKGLIKIAKLIEKMNRKKPSKFLESSETKRQVRESE